MMEFQSTHPRGVRHQKDFFLLYFSGFQSTHPRGVRLGVVVIIFLDRKFQSTHPRGVRLIVFAPLITDSGFNPRTHEGCDIIQYGYRYQGIVSIHAPTRGATRRDISPLTIFFLFQSTHPRGVRLD